MFKSNIEIEFKTAVDKEKYLKMLHHFNLQDNIFLQTNYYFDTKDLELNKNDIVLRIRKKGDRFKVTLKKQGEKGAFENHVFLTKEQAEEMIKNGFNTKDYFKDLDYDVTFKASLDNYRVSTPYLNGKLFLDRCDYHEKTEYEIEFEVDNYEEGEIEFFELLKQFDVTFVKTKRKSERALK
jgi:uncharacterized protein YjbK